MNEIAKAFVAACRDEIEAAKPGNVHIFADGHGMMAGDFLQSAEAAAPFLSAPASTIGSRIYGAAEATFAAVGKNTNIGIILLCAPLAAAAEKGGNLRARLHDELAGLTCQDAACTFKAILRAGPAGLGTAPRHDVRGPASVTLLEAMREAAGRDRIAYQYASDFADIFGIGMESLKAAADRGWKAPWPATSVYLSILSDIPDTHIARKYGKETALRVREEAVQIRSRFMKEAHPEASLPFLLDFDKRLKDSRLNPGTSADLTVASVLAHRLTRGLIKRRNNG